MIDSLRRRRRKRSDCPPHPGCSCRLEPAPHPRPASHLRRRRPTPQTPTRSWRTQQEKFPNQTLTSNGTVKMQSVCRLSHLYSNKPSIPRRHTQGGIKGLPNLPDKTPKLKWILTAHPSCNFIFFVFAETVQQKLFFIYQNIYQKTHLKPDTWRIYYEKFTVHDIPDDKNTNLSGMLLA